MPARIAVVLFVFVFLLGLCGITAQANDNSQIYVPDTSIEYPGDNGVRAHTNHLFYIGANPNIGTGVGGAYSPQDIRRYYNLPSTGGAYAIAIVDAFNDPSALADFNKFSSQYGLPRETSTNRLAATNKVFQVVYAGGSKPSGNTGWSQEESLDIEWAHAMAPGAKIYLVEARSNSYTDLYAAIKKASSLPGVKEVSMSWGGSEFSGETSYDSYFHHSGIVYFASSGDYGAGVSYPSASPFVVAAGGTTINSDNSANILSETGWSGSGGGLSAYEVRPTFQNGISGIVGAARGVPDVSAIADPETGVSLFWHGSWYTIGGTSVSSPTLAGIANLAGHFRASSHAENAVIYGDLANYADFLDIISGNNGYPCRTGWDFVTGVGSPHGLHDM